MKLTTELLWNWYDMLGILTIMLALRLMPSHIRIMPEIMLA